MIGRIYEGFCRASNGRVLLLPEELGSTLDQAIETPSREAWFRLKAAFSIGSTKPRTHRGWGGVACPFGPLA